MNLHRYVLWLLILSSGCQKKRSDGINSIATADMKFFDKKYGNVQPIAQILNPKNFSSASVPFVIDSTEQFVHVYAVGEILFNLSQADKKYYLMGDDIKLYFRISQKQSNDLKYQEYEFAYKEAKKFRKEGITFEWDAAQNKTSYVAEVKIPLKNININTIHDGDSIDFNMAVGDNDDGFVQSSEISWLKHPESNVSYGKILFRKKPLLKPRINELISYYGTPSIDATIDQTWNDVPATVVKEVVRGYVKDYFDLSANVCSQWDKDAIYFLFKINDSRQKHIPKNKEKERGIFVDYGWIEDERGNIVWQMNAKYSKHAGGVLKNQMIDTSLSLPKGKYILKYVTDESHSYDDWIGAPPTIPFYGISLYKK